MPDRFDRVVRPMFDLGPLQDPRYQYRFSDIQQQNEIDPFTRSAEVFVKQFGLSNRPRESVEQATGPTIVLPQPLTDQIHRHVIGSQVAGIDPLGGQPR
jgi:hypothetical protein